MTAGGDRRLAFDEVAELYDRARPTYPDDLFEHLFAALPAPPTIVEVGPGTGIATRALLERGARVVAVELGPRLAEFLRSSLGGEGALSVLNSPFEEALLDEGSFDAVFAATAYHWVEESQQIERPHRLLRSRGLLAVIDLIQVGSPSDGGYFDRVQPIYEAFGNLHHDRTPPGYDAAEPPMAPRLRASRLFGDVRVHRIPWDQRYTSEQYRDLLLTYSGTRAMAAEARADMVDQLVSVIDDEFGGSITRPLVATLTTATRA